MTSIYKSVFVVMVLILQQNPQGKVMSNSQNEILYIGDTRDGKVIVSRSPAADIVEGPLQSLVITGQGNIAPPQQLMTRKEFTKWREALQDEGYTVELKFAS